MSSFGLWILFAIGIALLIASYPIVRLTREPNRALDHLARSVVALGVGLISVVTALYQFEQNLQRSDRLRDEQAQLVEQERHSRQEAADRLRQDQARQIEQERVSRQEAADRQRKEDETAALDHDRRTASLSFFRAMILYGISSRHMDYINLHCHLNDSSAVWDKPGCLESGALAIKFSNLLPSADLAFSQVARGVKDLDTVDIVRWHLVEGEAALKGRMPVSIENLIKAAIGTSRAELAVKTLEGRVNDFRIKADELSTIYCAFAHATEKGWDEFAKMVQQLDYKRGDIKTPSDQLAFFRQRVEGLKVGPVPCDDVRSVIDDLAPIGGGNGGGGGGN